MPRKTKKLTKRIKKKKGGENTSPNTKAARVIQSRFRNRNTKRNAAARSIQSRIRGNRSRKLTGIKKQLETLDPYLKQHILDMIGRGKYKGYKKKKLTNKKSKSRSKRGGWVLNGGKRSSKSSRKRSVKQGEWSIIKSVGKMFGGWPNSNSKTNLFKV